jgi:hypothetical protein
MKATLVLALLLASCGDTGCRIEESTTRVTRLGETYYERCWREVCPNSPTIQLRCQRI